VGTRLFIAVDIDEATRGQVARISAALRPAIERHTKASWVPPDRMHLTLHFFGSVEAAVERRVLQALADPIHEAPFDITFDRLGFFPERGSPRVVWLGIRDGLESLRRVHAVVTEALMVRQDHDGVFTPHLTLARLRGRLPRAEVEGISAVPAAAGPSRIDRVTVYESRLSPAGPTYVPLAAAHLKP
jgi:RNA 2',3'-cyclic 3'-phosphodiesterase